MFWRTVRVACVCAVVAAVAAPACGGNSSNPGTDSGGGGNGGRAGSGGSGGKAPLAGAAGNVATLECGTATCKPVVIPVQDFTIPPCCADAATNQCGLDSSVLAAFGPTFPEACQPLDQPGTADESCPKSAKTPVQGTQLEIQFDGCCRPDHTCGYMLDRLGGLFEIGLGCVDSAPFLDGGAPTSCGDAGGEGGAGGAGGADSGSAGMAGESAAGAAGG